MFWLTSNVMLGSLKFQHGAQLFQNFELVERRAFLGQGQATDQGYR